MKFTRREMILCALGCGAAVALATRAQLGWDGFGSSLTEVTGKITQAQLHRPEGLLKLDTGGAVWTVDIGTPEQNRMAGLDDAMIAPGRQITVFGKREEARGGLRMMAEAVVTGGQRFAVTRPARSVS